MMRWTVSLPLKEESNNKLGWIHVRKYKSIIILQLKHCTTSQPTLTRVGSS